MATQTPACLASHLNLPTEAPFGEHWRQPAPVQPCSRLRGRLCRAGGGANPDATHETPGKSSLSKAGPSRRAVFKCFGGGTEKHTHRENQITPLFQGAQWPALAPSARGGLGGAVPIVLPLAAVRVSVGTPPPPGPSGSRSAEAPALRPPSLPVVPPTPNTAEELAADQSWLFTSVSCAPLRRGPSSRPLPKPAQLPARQALRGDDWTA